MKIFLYYIGKPRDADVNRLAAGFVERISHYAKTEIRELRPDRGTPWEKHAAAYKICVDPAGKPMDSRAFSALIARNEMAGRDLVFAIGGHDGLPASWRDGADLALSLSPMTFPHELARAMLCEQIYRAFTILRNHPYPR